MSHFTTYVFTRKNGERNVDDMLAPYDENIEYKPYIEYTKQQAIEHVRTEIEDYKHSDIYQKFIADPEKYKEEHGSNTDHINYLENEFPIRLKWTDEECYEHIKSFYEEDMVDEEGNLYSMYNPNSKWDWYTIGGRWDGVLICKNGEGTNEDYVSEIDWDKTSTPFAFIDLRGEWHENGTMGWWACVTNEKDRNVWEDEFKNYIKNLEDDVIVTVVDCHI